MKKIILALSITLLPLTVHAQSGGDRVIQAAANELKPAFCNNDLKKAIEIVEGCYAKVDEDSEKYNMNQCVIEDSVVLSAIQQKQKKYISNYMADPYANLEYMQSENIGRRLLKHPNFLTNLENSDSVKEAASVAIQKAIAILKEENCIDIDKLK